jgi:hypothetical protein
MCRETQHAKYSPLVMAGREPVLCGRIVLKTAVGRIVVRTSMIDA